MNTTLTAGDLQVLDDEPRILDLRIGERLEMAQPLDIRRTIEANREELERYGEVFAHRPKTSDKGGRPATEYHLNEAQTLLLCMFSRTEKAADVRQEVISVYMAYRQGLQTGAANPTTIPMKISDASMIVASLTTAIKAMDEAQEIKSQGRTGKYRETVKLLISETALSDEEIALRMEPMLKEYMPEWVSYMRRLMLKKAS